MNAATFESKDLLNSFKNDRRRKVEEIKNV